MRVLLRVSIRLLLLAWLSVFSLARAAGRPAGQHTLHAEGSQDTAIDNTRGAAPLRPSLSHMLQPRHRTMSQEVVELPCEVE